MGNQAWKIFCDPKLPPYTHDINNIEIKVGDIVKYTTLAEKYGYFGVVYIEEIPEVGIIDMAIVFEEEFRPLFAVTRYHGHTFRRPRSFKKIPAQQGFFEIIRGL